MPDEMPLPSPDGESPLPPAEEPGLPPHVKDEAPLPPEAALPSLSHEMARESKAAPAAEKKSMGRGPKIAAAALAVAMVGGVALLNPFDNAEPKRSSGENVAEATYTDEEDDAYLESLKPWYAKSPDEAIAGDRPDWALMPTPADAAAFTDDERKYFRDLFEETEYDFTAANTLFSEEMGFSSNPEDAVTDEGLPNPLYAYITYEVFMDQTGAIVERLLNPYYGGWGEYQFGGSKASSSFDQDRLASLFTDGYRQRNFSKADKSYLPVFADWNNNNYGRDDLIPTGEGRWVGTVKDARVSFKYDPATLSYTADALYQVEFEAKTVDKKTITREGTLRILFATVPGVGAEVESERPSEGEDLRLRIDQATLTVQN